VPNPVHHRGPAPAEDPQGRANAELWAPGSYVSSYATRDLRPVEVILLVRYREAISGRVLELGCGAGRLTGYLSQIAADTRGLDISTRMVEYCRRRYPRATFEVGDLRDVTVLEPGSFGAIVAAYNILDILNDHERADVLDGIHRGLETGGLLIMSSHNRAYARKGVRGALARNGIPGLVRTSIELPRWVLNRRRLVPFERDEADYAIRNDVSHQFGALHYYITRDGQDRQFAEHGFRLLECLDLEGQVVRRGEDARRFSELHYVARRV
jgi:SAM-dependent methyltransferase